jgi:hypothetical protein
VLGEGSKDTTEQWGHPWRIGTAINPMLAPISKYVVWGFTKFRIRRTLAASKIPS